MRRFARPISSASTCRCTRRRGWPAPLIRKSARRSTASARLCAYGLVRAAQRRLAAVARRRRRARRRVRSRNSLPLARRSRARATPHVGRRSPLPRLHFLVPDRTGLPPLDRYATLQLRRRHARRSPATPKPAAGAGISAAIVRSCRSTTVSSASCSGRRAGGHRRAGGRRRSSTSPSAIPTFSTVRHTRCGIVEALHARASVADLRRDDQDRAPAPAPRARCRVLRRHRLSLRDERGRVGRRSTCWTLLDEGAHAARLSSRPSHCAARRADARADVRRRSIRGRRSTATAICSTTLAALDLVEHVAPIQLAIRLLIPRGSRMLELPDVAGLVGAVRRRRRWPIHGRIPIHASTRCTQTSCASSAGG